VAILHLKKVLENNNETKKRLRIIISLISSASPELRIIGIPAGAGAGAGARAGVMAGVLLFSSLLFSSLLSVRSGSGAHPASYPMGTGVSFPVDKAAEA
jgi:hypothetical protein